MDRETKVSGTAEGGHECQLNFWAKTTDDGKPGMSVRDHCLNVGCVAEALMALLPGGTRKMIPPAALVLAAGHDIGKISVGFMRKCPAWLVSNNLSDRSARAGWQLSESNHAAVSQDFFFTLLRPKKAHHWAIAVGGHHGRFLGKGRVVKNEIESRWAQPEREKLFAELARHFGQPPDLPPDSETQLLLVAGWITVADWIGSNEEFFPLLGQYTLELSRERAQGALKRIRWGHGRLRGGLSFGQLFQSSETSSLFEPTALQRLCVATVSRPGLYLIEAPMGSGKTEAALAAAYRLISRRTSLRPLLRSPHPTHQQSNPQPRRAVSAQRAVGGNRPSTGARQFMALSKS